jgi:hypothetical protein
VKLPEGERFWSRIELDDYVIDFEKVLGEVIEYAVAYAVCYIDSEADQHGLNMVVRSDDSSKVYLNERQVYRYAFGGMFGPDHTVTGIELKAGLNVLVFKIVNTIQDWRGSIQFTDAQGEPVRGIRVTLDPDAKNQP